jgi:hypothetical protein
MSIVSFSNKPKAAAAIQTAEQSQSKPGSLALTALPPLTQMVPSLSQSAQIQGEFTARDMAIPYLNLGQKSGTMCDNHPDWIGGFVYDKSSFLGNEIRIVVGRLKKRYEEVLEFGSPEIPQQFDTIAAAQAAGIEVRDVAEIDVLVECNRDMEQFAMFEADGKAYAPARYVVRSSAYGRTVGIILKDLAGWLKNDLPSGFYAMTTEKRSGNGNSWFVPKLAAAGKVSEDLRNVIREKFGV